MAMNPASFYVDGTESGPPPRNKYVKKCKNGKKGCYFCQVKPLRAFEALQNSKGKRTLVTPPEFIVCYGIDLR